MKFRGHTRVHSNSYYYEHHYIGLSKDEARRAIQEYNGSSWMLGLPPLRDALAGVARLVDAGYKFHCITSMGDDPYSKELRMMNLERVFGNDVFDELTVIGMGDSKEPILSKYKDSGLVWIEDKASNARIGAKLGLDAILMDHLYNQDSKDDGLLRVANWADICNYMGV